MHPNFIFHPFPFPHCFEFPFSITPKPDSEQQKKCGNRIWPQLLHLTTTGMGFNAFGPFRIPRREGLTFLFGTAISCHPKKDEGGGAGCMIGAVHSVHMEEKRAAEQAGIVRTRTAERQTRENSAAAMASTGGL